METIYFPMTANILTPGHIRCLEYLADRGQVIVGLLSSEALKGYKKEVVPYEDREYIMETVAMGIMTSFGNSIVVVRQDSLDPSENAKAFGCTVLASGDGFEPSEEASAKALGMSLLNIKLEGETEKKYSSSKILNG